MYVDIHYRGRLMQTEALPAIDRKRDLGFNCSIDAIGISKV